MRHVPAQRQRGIVLMLSLTFLVILTLLGLAAINMSTVNLRVVGNDQELQFAEAQAKRGIEVAISAIQHFENNCDDIVSGDLPTNVTVDCGCHWTSKTGVDDDKESYSEQWELAPDSTVWEIISTYDDGRANVILRQGVRIKMSAGSCT